jgi:hypothetical protein
MASEHSRYIEAGEGKLISRNGNVFRGFIDLAAWIAEHLRVWVVIIVFAENFDTLSVCPTALSVIGWKPLLPGTIHN